MIKETLQLDGMIDMYVSSGIHTDLFIYLLDFF